MIASTLLLGLSALLFGAVVPAMQREDWFSQKQTNTRGFLIARERLTRELRHIQLVDVAVPFDDGPDKVLLQYHRPNISSTNSHGDLGNFNLSEIVLFDLDVIHELRLLASGLLVLRNTDTDERRIVWRLTENTVPAVTISPDSRRVDFNFQGTSDDRFQTAWEFDLTVLVR